MATEEERCAAAKAFRRIDEAFQNGRSRSAARGRRRSGGRAERPVARAIGSCLVYAIYHSPLRFIRTLLEIGADPERSGRRWVSTAHRRAELQPRRARWAKRTDVDAVIRMLLVLRRGSEPARHQRLHAAAHGGGRTQSARDPAAARRRRRSGSAHAHRRVSDTARDGGVGRLAGDRGALRAKGARGAFSPAMQRALDVPRYTETDEPGGRTPQARPEPDPPVSGRYESISPRRSNRSTHAFFVASTADLSGSF